MRTIPAALALLALPGWGGHQSDPLASRSLGRADAPVVVYVMSDFQCPYCRQFALTTFPPLEREFVQTGKARFVFVNLPLTQVHRHAVAAAAVAMCAARQSKFWPVHDLLFRRQEQWAQREQPGPYLLALGDSAGADRAQLAPCVASRATEPEIRADAARAARAGAKSTPTFYIEGGLLEGSAPVEVFRQVLDSIYKSKTAPAR
jgi:protein-disulfide isomerase